MSHLEILYDALVSVLVTKKPSRKSIRLLRGRGEAADRDEREVLIEEEMQYQRLYPRHIGSR